jgi:hypothetical protein
MLQIQKDVFNNATSLVFHTYAPEPDDPQRYDPGSAWLFVENLCLAAVSEGLGIQLFAYWDDAEEEVNQLLGAPDKDKQVIGVNIGVQHPDFKPETKVLKSKSKWIFREKDSLHPCPQGLGILTWFREEYGLKKVDHAGSDTTIRHSHKP